MKRLMPAAGLFLLFVIGCSMRLSGPSVEQVKQDLVGKEVRIITKSVFGLPDMTWMTVARVQDLVIQQRFTDKAAGTDELHALVTVTFVTLTRREESSPRRGGLIIGYKQFEQGWKLQSVKVTGEFSDITTTGAVVVDPLPGTNLRAERTRKAAETAQVQTVEMLERIAGWGFKKEGDVWVRVFPSGTIEKVYPNGVQETITTIIGEPGETKRYCSWMSEGDANLFGIKVPSGAGSSRIVACPQ